MKKITIAATIFAISLSGAVSADAADLVRVGIPEASNYMFAVLDVGTGAHIFEKHNLTIEKTAFPGAGKLQEAMTAGVIDLTVSGNTDMALILKGVPQKAVAVTAGPPVDMALVVRADGDITRAADLKGKIIGVTSPTSLTSWLALDLARRQGWGSDGVQRAYVGAMSSMVAALQVRNVDAIIGPLTGGLQMEAAGQGHLIPAFGDMKVFITHMIYASDSVIKNNPATLRSFLQAWFETVTYMRANRDETIRLTMPATQLPPDLAAKIYEVETPALSTTGRFDSQAVATLIQSYIDLGIVETVPKDKILFTEEFLP